MSFARAGLFAITMATACDWGPQYCEADWAAADPEAAPAKVRSRTVAQVLPADSKAVDILFVIDDSSSMTDEQKQLGIWSSTLFEVLSGTGELPDLHIAVTSSSVSIPGITQCESRRGGTFQVGAAVLDGDRFLRDVATPDGRDRNYTGTLTEAFAKMANVGDSGCGYEQPFKAARLALSHTTKTTNFLRDEALLLVVFVTDEDDCSSSNPALFGYHDSDACSDLGTLTSYRCFEHGVRCYDGKGSREFGERHDCRADEQSRFVAPVSELAAFLKGVKPDPAQVIVAAIYGKPNGVNVIRDERVLSHDTPRLANVCGKGGVEGTGATPGIRMNALLAEFGGRASQSSICESELSWAMGDIGKTTRRAATRSRCLSGSLADADRAPGIQPTCRVEGLRRIGTGIEQRTRVPRCDGGRTRCFTIETDAECSDTESGLAFHVFDPAADETLTIACDVDE